MNTVLITGCNGYIGRHVCEKMLEMDCCKVVGVSRTFSDDVVPDYFCQCDIFNETELGELLKSHKITHCIHLAWRNGFDHNNRSHMEDLPFHIKFISTLAKSGCRNISVIGTMHEVGFYEGMVSDQTPCNPRTFYGIAKNALRQALIVMSKIDKFNLKWLRVYYITGDDQRNNSVLTKLLLAAKSGCRKFPFTTGESLYDFIDVNILADQIIKATIQDKINGVIECCSGEPQRLRDVVEKFIKDRNLDIDLEFGKYPERPYDSKIIYGDRSQIDLILNTGIK